MGSFRQGKGATLHGMFQIWRTLRERPLMSVGVCIGAVFALWFLFFMWEFGKALLLARSGKGDPAAELRRRTFEASVGRIFGNANVTPADLLRLEQGSHPTLGRVTAPVHIVEFVDYGCPFCKQVAPTFRAFVERHPDDVYVVIRDFPITELHPQAQVASLAARCVFAQGRPEVYWRYYDRLFASQDAQDEAALRLYALQSGAALPAYDACVAAQGPLSDIQRSVDDGVAAGVSGTPTFFFNGVKIQGALDADAFEILFKEAKQRITP